MPKLSGSRHSQTGCVNRWIALHRVEDDRRGCYMDETHGDTKRHKHRHPAFSAAKGGTALGVVFAATLPTILKSLERAGSEGELSFKITPVEAAALGFAVGAVANGYRAVVHNRRMDKETASSRYVDNLEAERRQSRSVSQGNELSGSTPSTFRGCFRQ